MILETPKWQLKSVDEDAGFRIENIMPPNEQCHHESERPVQQTRAIPLPPQEWISEK